MKQINQIEEDNKKLWEEFKKLSLKVTEDRPPVISVYKKSNTANYSLLSEDGLSKGMRNTINSGMHIYIRNEIYRKIKFIKDDAMAQKLIKKATEIFFPNSKRMETTMLCDVYEEAYIQSYHYHSTK